MVSVLDTRSTFALPLAYKGSGRHKRGIRSRKNGRSAGTDRAEARVLALAKTGDLDAFEQLDLFPRLADLFLVLTTKVY